MPDSTPDEPPVLLTPQVLGWAATCAGGFMFAGMGVWILILDPRPAAEAALWAGWRGRDVLVALAAAFFLRGTAQLLWAAGLWQWEARGGRSIPPMTQNLGQGAWQTLACVLAVTVFALAPYGLDIDALRLVPAGVDWLAAGAAVGLAAGPGAFLLAAALFRWSGSPLRVEGAQAEFLAPAGVWSWAGVAGMVLLGIVLVPCAEEVLFRGVVYPGLRRELGPGLAVTASALLFGFAHHRLGREVVIASTIFGVAFALLTEGSGSLWPAVVAHVLVNTKLLAAYSRAFRAPADPPPAV